MTKRLSFNFSDDLYDGLQHVSTNYKWTLRTTFVATFCLHTLLATFAAMIATYLELERSATVKWVRDVFCVGVFSFSKLLTHLLETHEEEERRELRKLYNKRVESDDCGHFEYARKVAKFSNNS